MTEQVRAVVDSNEASQNPDILVYLDQNNSVSKWEVEPRDEGDLIFPEVPCIIERKTPSDFASSMTKGRLKDQAKRMANSCSNSYILIAGNFEDFGTLGNTRVKETSLRGFSASLTAKTNVPVVPVSTEEILVDYAVRLARKHKEEESSEVIVPSSIRDNDEPTVLRMYACIPGVGPEMARTLYSEYPELPLIQNASESELLSIDGLGPSTLDNLILALQ